MTLGDLCNKNHNPVNNLFQFQNMIKVIKCMMMQMIEYIDMKSTKYYLVRMFSSLNGFCMLINVVLQDPLHYRNSERDKDMNLKTNNNN